MTALLPRVAAALLVVLGTSACGGSKGGSPSGPSGSGPPSTSAGTVASALQTLSGRAIYFGHQSVGFNIVAGLQALISAGGAGPHLVQSSAASTMTKGVFAHQSNGSNGDPIGKTRAFRATVEGGVGGKVDIAFFKFCYVDFGGGSDVNAVFADYRSQMAALRTAYPSVRFVHVTVPLTTSSSGDNAVRERFNELLRQAYPSEPLFDLAEAESTRPDGSRELLNGVPALVSSYSSDGGHLNATGADVVARALVLYLATL